MSTRSKWIEGHVVNKRRWTERLYSLQVDAPIEPFRAGQFGRLALDIDDEKVARSYSFVNAPEERPLEFYFITVPDGPLTQRMVALEPGDPIWVAPRPSGLFTLAGVPESEHMWMLSTGTAIGPFISILKTAEPWQRFSKIILVHAVRHVEELTYQETVRDFQARYPERFTMIPFVSREDTDFAIKGRVPEAIVDGRLEAHAGVPLNATQSHVMICGNPDMVRNTMEVLEARGLTRNRRKEPGQITIEAYW